MTTEYKIRNGKLQCDINREVAKISTLSSGNIDKHEYLIGEKILLCDQSRMIERARAGLKRLFVCCHLTLGVRAGLVGRDFFLFS